MSIPAHRAVPGRPFVSILNYNRPYWRTYLGGASLAVVFVLVGLAMPLVIRATIRQLETDNMSMSGLAFYFLLLVAIALATGLARYWERTLMIGASRKFEYDLRNDYFRHIQRLSRRFFHRTKTGDIMARATNDLNFVRSLVGPGFMGTVDMLQLPFTLAVMVYLSPKLTLIAAAPFPFLCLFVYLLVMYMHRQSKEVQEQFSEVTSRAQENLAGARVVRAYAVAKSEVHAFREAATKYMRESLKLATVISLTWPSLRFIIGLTILIVLWRGGLMVIRNEDFAASDLIGFLTCLMMLAWPVVEFGWVLTLYQRGVVGMNRIIDILAVEPEIQDGEQTDHDISGIPGSIRFKNVSFAYRDRKVLHNVDFEAGRGETVAIVGPTGSGKSTIASLLTRDYDPTEGCVVVDGVDLRRIPLRILRGSIGYVPQDTFLFSESIRANLTMGRPEATQEEMDSACEAAQIRETICQLENGYDTVLGERGVNLSGGQKQRLAIARAIIRDPQILILDDALSSVDTHTEEQILRRLKEITSVRTSIIISHRVSTIRHADTILVIDDGRIVEQGTHDDLVAMGGPYAEIYERQLLEEELEDRA